MASTTTAVAAPSPTVPITIDDSAPQPTVLKARISVNHGQPGGAAANSVLLAIRSSSPSSSSVYPSSPPSMFSSSSSYTSSPPLSGKFSFAELQHIHSDLYGHPIRLAIRLKDFLSSSAFTQSHPPPNSCVVLYVYDAAIRRYKFINRTECVSSTHHPIFETQLIVTADQRSVFAMNESQSHEYIRTDVLLFYVFSFEWEPEDEQLQIDVEEGLTAGGYPCIEGYTACTMINYNELVHNKGGKIQLPLHNIHSIEWNEMLRQSHSSVVIQQILPDYLKASAGTTTPGNTLNTLNLEYLNRLKIMNSQQIWTRAVVYDEENQPQPYLFALSAHINITSPSSQSQTSPSSSASSALPWDFLPLVSIWYRSASNSTWELIGDYWDPLEDEEQNGDSKDRDKEKDKTKEEKKKDRESEVDPNFKSFIFPFSPPSSKTPPPAGSVNETASFQIRLHNRFTLRSKNISHYSDYFNELKSHSMTVAFGSIIPQKEIVNFFPSLEMEAISANAAAKGTDTKLFPLKFLVNDECTYVKSHPTLSLDGLSVGLHVTHKPVHGPLEEIPSATSPSSIMSSSNRLSLPLVDKLLQKCKDIFTIEGIKLHTYVARPVESTSNAAAPSSHSPSSTIVRTVMYYRDSPTPRLAWSNYKSYKAVVEKFPNLSKPMKGSDTLKDKEREAALAAVDGILDLKRSIDIPQLSTIIGGKTHPAFYLDAHPRENDSDNVIFSNINDFQCFSVYNEKKLALHVSAEDFDVVSEHDIKMISSSTSSSSSTPSLVSDSSLVEKRSELILLRNAFVWMILKIALSFREKEVEDKLAERNKHPPANPNEPIVVSPIVCWQMDKLIPTAPKYFKPQMPNRVPPKSPRATITPTQPATSLPVLPSGTSFSLAPSTTSPIEAHPDSANVDFTLTKDDEQKYSKEVKDKEKEKEKDKITSKGEEKSNQSEAPRKDAVPPAVSSAPSNSLSPDGPSHHRQQSAAKSSNNRRASSLDLGFLLGKVQSLLENGRNFARWLATRDAPQMIALFLVREAATDTQKYPLRKMCTLYWSNPNTKNEASWRSLKFDEIDGIVLGKQTAVLKRDCCELSPSHCCFSIVGKGHSLHLQTNSERETETMVFGLASLIKSYQKQKPKLYQLGQLAESQGQMEKEILEEKVEDKRNSEAGYSPDNAPETASNAPTSGSSKNGDVTVDANGGSKKRRSTTVIVNNNVDNSQPTPTAFSAPRPTMVAPPVLSASSFSVSLMVKCRSLPLKYLSSICCLFDRDDEDDSIQYLCQSDKVTKSASPDFLKHFNITVIYPPHTLNSAKNSPLPSVKLRLNVYDVPPNSKAMEDDYRIGTCGFVLNDISQDEGIEYIYKLSHEDKDKQLALNKLNSQIVLQCIGRVEHDEAEAKAMAPPTNASVRSIMTVFAYARFPNGVVPQPPSSPSMHSMAASAMTPSLANDGGSESVKSSKKPSEATAKTKTQKK